MKKPIFFALFILISIVNFQKAEALWSSKNGWFRDSDEFPTLPVADHYKIAIRAFDACDWKEAARHFRIVAINFPNSEYGPESNYNLGICYFNLQEYDFAEEAFSAYLKCKNNPKYFFEAVEYKFCIAERYKAGAKKRFFGTKQLPKWASGESSALILYDEVIASLPAHELAAKALYSKASLLRRMQQYRESIDCYQTLIRRFPKHELAPESYLAILSVYQEQSQAEFQNPDILAFAQITLRKFAQDFPREERLCEAEAMVARIKEIYAMGLYDTGKFYEKIKQRKAAVLYYLKTINEFPDTRVAQICKKRLKVLCPQREESSEDVTG